ncbi:MAG: hypothetical protein DYH12_03010 [Sorangiineae bacterium PRO1]|nr:hypothetical protein [Sorangiineae bacterium PRO1]
MTRVPHGAADRERRLLRDIELTARLVLRARADRDASALERAAVERAARVTIERMREIEGRERHAGAADERRWNEEVLPLVRDCEQALEGSHADAALSALETFRRAHGGRPSWSSMCEFEDFLASRTPLDLTPHPPAGRPSQRDRVNFNSLGQRCVAPPVPAIVADRALIETLLADALYEPVYRGLHLAALRQGPAGLKYTHHGISVGDGTVVHFTGEPQAMAEASVDQTDLADFVASSTHLETRTPKTFKAKPVAHLRKNLTVLRALTRKGERGYSLLSSNCEHFSVWAQLGADYSDQVSHIVEAQIRAQRADAAQSAAADETERLLAPILTFDVGHFTAPREEDLEPEPVILDLGRAYWAEDLRAPVIWVPLWDERSGIPPADADRPWSLAGGKEWSRNPPTSRMRREWHAALIWVAGHGFWWLADDGSWLSPSFDVLAACEDRLAATSRVIISYLVTSHFPTNALNIFDRLGGRVIVEKAAGGQTAVSRDQPPP